MTVKKKLLVACLIGGGLGTPSLTWSDVVMQGHQQQHFVVKDIRVEGRRRVKLGAVLNALPIQLEDSIDSKRIADAIHKLYQTGEFDYIDISMDGGVLVIQVVERKTISAIRFVGNKELKEKQLLDILKRKVLRQQSQ